MGALSPVAKQQFFDNNGDLLVGGKLYTYVSGASTTPLATYTDAALSVANANPVILDARGECTLYLQDAQYRYVLKDSSDVTIWTRDNIVSPLLAGALGGTSPLIVDNIAELEALTGMSNDALATTLGYYTDDDGGHGTYRYDSSSTATVNGLDIINASGGAGRWLLRHHGVADFRVGGAKADGVTDNSTVLEAFKDAGITPVINKSGGSYVIQEAVIDSPFTIKFEGGEVTSGGIDTDCILLSDSIEVYGYGQITLCRSFLNIQDSAPTTLSIIAKTDNLYISNAHDFIVGNYAVAAAADRLILSGLRFEDMEIGVFTRDIGWSYVMVDNCQGFDFKLKSLTARPTGGKFNTYYVSGILIDAQGYDGSATAVNCVFKQIYNAMVDPVTLAVVTPGDIENHGIAIETDGSVTITGCNIEDLSANLTPSDVEGIIARGREISVTGNTLYDAGDDEGCIYTKGSTYGSVTGNTVIFSTMAADTNEKFGLVVSSKEIAVSGNTFVNCGRGINLRVGVKLGWNNFVNCVAGVFNGIDSASEVLFITGAFKGCTLPVSSANTAALTLLELTGATIELPVGGKILNTLSASALITDYIVKGCTIMGTNAQTTNELILFQATNAVNMQITGNTFRDVKKSSGTLSVVRVNNDANNFYVKDNIFDGANECIRLRDRTYANLICADNFGFDLTGSLVNNTAVTVTGTNVTARNNA